MKVWHFFGLAYVAFGWGGDWLSELEGRTFAVTERLSGEECASTLLARCEYVPIRSMAASMPPRAKTVLTLGY
ncbi:hypothetical protein TUM4644_37640 [Shewanella colwelliana]|nr:hypothetical protein TUM4644_37640 [Shewanella colwelliana]